MFNLKVIRNLIIGIIVVMSLFSFSVVFQERLLLFPLPLTQDHKYQFDHQEPFEELFFRPDDNVLVNALYFTTPNPKGLIFYLHGNASNLQRYGQFAIDFTQKGYNILMYDYRQFGKSKGELNEESFYTDAQWLYDEVKNCYGFEQDQIVIYGRSLGSGIATKLASQNQPRSLMLETPYYNIADVARRYVPFIPYDKLLRYNFRSDLWIQEVKCPVYIFHGTKDRVVPYASGSLLKPFLENPDRFITIPGAGHNNLRKYEQYHQFLQQFLEEGEMKNTNPTKSKEVK